MNSLQQVMHEWLLIVCNTVECFSIAYLQLNTLKYRVRINYRRILQNHIFTNTEEKYMMLLPFERGMFAVS